MPDSRRIEIRIERIIVTGLTAARDTAAIGRALEVELARLLGAGPIDRTFGGNKALEGVSVPMRETPVSAEQFGGAIAGGIVEGLTR